MRAVVRLSNCRGCERGFRDAGRSPAVPPLRYAPSQRFRVRYENGDRDARSRSGAVPSRYGMIQRSRSSATSLGSV